MRQADLAAYATGVRRRRNRLRLRVSGEPVLTATTGVAYAGFAMSATGGTQPYVFSVLYGALPADITVDPDTGAVAGTPVAPGTHKVTLGVTDAYGKQALLPTFTLEVS